MAVLFQAREDSYRRGFILEIRSTHLGIGFGQAIAEEELLFMRHGRQRHEIRDALIMLLDFWAEPLRHLENSNARPAAARRLYEPVMIGLRQDLGALLTTGELSTEVLEFAQDKRRREEAALRNTRSLHLTSPAVDVLDARDFDGIWDNFIGGGGGGRGGEYRGHEVLTTGNGGRGGPARFDDLMQGTFARVDVVITTEAEKKARETLKTYLTPTQRDALERCNYFDVTLKGGGTMRLRPSRSYNGTLLEGCAWGNRNDQFCAVPKRNEELPVWDQLLIQKLWLETDPRQFFNAANRADAHGRFIRRQPDTFLRTLQENLNRIVDRTIIATLDTIS